MKFSNTSGSQRWQSGRLSSGARYIPATHAALDNNTNTYLAVDPEPCKPGNSITAHRNCEK